MKMSSAGAALTARAAIFRTKLKKQEVIMTNEQRDQQAPNGSQQGSHGNSQPASRSDTLAPAGSVPVEAPPRPTGADIVGASGGTDAAAGAEMSGSSGGPGGAGLRQEADAAGVPGSPGGSLGGGSGPGAGAAAAGGTGLGEAAPADNTSPGTGPAPGGGMGVAGGNPSSGATPPPTNKGGASSA
jgi:hypothetical protein